MGKPAEQIQEDKTPIISGGRIPGMLSGAIIAVGREYVESYVEFTHFVEAAQHLINAGASHQHIESSESEHGH
ncbi:MAG: hypothetical protein WCZ66_08260 [Sphingomonadaceae bacterium]